MVNCGKNHQSPIGSEKIMLKDQKSFHINQIDSYLVKILKHPQTSQHTLVKLILMQSHNFNKLKFFCDHLVRVERFFLRNSEYSWTCSRRYSIKPLSLLQLTLWGSLLEACYQQLKVSCLNELFFASISILSPIFKRLSHSSWETVSTVEPVLRGIVLSGQLSKSCICFPLVSLIFTSTKQLWSSFTKSQGPVCTHLPSQPFK